MKAEAAVLILGTGPRISASVAKTFASYSYKAAVVLRSESDTKAAAGYFLLKAVFTQSDDLSLTSRRNLVALTFCVGAIIYLLRPILVVMVN